MLIGVCAQKQFNTVPPRLAQVRSPACVATSVPQLAMSTTGPDVPAFPSQEGTLHPTAAERMSQAPMTPPRQPTPTVEFPDTVAPPSQDGGPTLQLPNKDLLPMLPEHR